jgi:hypothetical protein
VKIEHSNIIRIFGRKGTADSFKDIKKGSELPARILERVDARVAVLEIHGKRVRAEFVKGLPSSGTILLKLEGVKNNSYLFRMIDPSVAEESARHILDYTVFDPKEVGKNVFHGISKFFSKTPTGIFELNAFFLTILQSARKRRNEPHSFSINY